MRIQFVTSDVIGRSQGGPGARYLELARLLRPRHEVTLAMDRHDPEANSVDGIPVIGPAAALASAEQADVVVTQLVRPELIRAAAKGRTTLIADMYDPVLTNVISSRGAGRAPALDVAAARSQQRLNLRYADHVICASTRQRDYLLGAAIQAGRNDVSDLDMFCTVVPFGCPSQPPPQRPLDGIGPARRAFGLGAEALVIIWAGSLWSWFDPNLAVQALRPLIADGHDAHLIFMGTRYPSQGHQEMATVDGLKATINRNGLQRNVHLNDGWVAYSERGAWLTDADIGISTHLAGTETHLSFRTRILDFMWAGLPIVATEGDHFAEVIHREGLGHVVPVGDSAALSQAFRALASGATRSAFRSRVTAAAGRRTWDASAGSLEECISRAKPRGQQKLRRTDLLHYYAPRVGRRLRAVTTQRP